MNGQAINKLTPRTIKAPQSTPRRAWLHPQGQIVFRDNILGRHVVCLYRFFDMNSLVLLLWHRLRRMTIRPVTSDDIPLLSEYWYDTMALLQHMTSHIRLLPDARGRWERYAQDLVWDPAVIFLAAEVAGDVGRGHCWSPGRKWAGSGTGVNWHCRVSGSLTCMRHIDSMALPETCCRH